MALIQHSREADANESLPEYGGAIAPNRSAASDTGSYDYDAEYGGAITASNESAGLVEEQQQAGGRKMHLVRSLPSSSVWRTVKERAEFLEEIADFLDDYPSAYLPQREAVPEVRSLDNGQTLPFPTGIPDTEEIDTVSMSLPAIVYRGAEKEISRKLVNQDFRCFTPHQKKLTKPGADLFCDILGVDQQKGMSASSENKDLKMLLAPFDEDPDFRDPERVSALYRQLASEVAFREDGMLPKGTVHQVAEKVLKMPKSDARRRRHKRIKDQTPEDSQDISGGPPPLLQEIPQDQRVEMLYQQGKEPGRLRKLLKFAVPFGAGATLGQAGGVAVAAGIATVASTMVVGGLIVGVPLYLAIKLRGDLQRFRQDRQPIVLPQPVPHNSLRQ